MKMSATLSETTRKSEWTVTTCVPGENKKDQKIIKSIKKVVTIFIQNRKNLQLKTSLKFDMILQFRKKRRKNIQLVW